MPYRIDATRSFLKASKRLARKYQHLKHDLRTLHEQLSLDPHQGVAIPGFSHRVWKIRLASRDIKRGKQGGYRIIYAIEEPTRTCYLLFIYVKAERANISVSEIEKLLEDLEDTLF